MRGEVVRNEASWYRFTRTDYVWMERSSHELGRLVVKEETVTVQYEPMHDTLASPMVASRLYYEVQEKGYGG